MVILMLILALYKADMETLPQTLGRIRGHETRSRQVNAGTCWEIHMTEGPRRKTKGLV